MRVLLTAMKLLQSGEKQYLFHVVNNDAVSGTEDKKMYERDKSFVWCYWEKFLLYKQ
jgi:hypothetical protein